MTPKQRPVKFATILLPRLCLAVERRVKNTLLPILNKISRYMKTSAAQVKCSACEEVDYAAPMRCMCPVALMCPIGAGRYHKRAKGLRIMRSLFNFNLRACGLDLLLDLVRFFLCHAFLNGLGRSFNERLGVRQTQSRHGAANFLNHSN